MLSSQDIRSCPCHRGPIRLIASGYVAGKRFRHVVTSRLISAIAGLVVEGSRVGAFTPLSSLVRERCKSMTKAHEARGMRVRQRECRPGHSPAGALINALGLSPGLAGWPTSGRRQLDGPYPSQRTGLPPGRPSSGPAAYSCQCWAYLSLLVTERDAYRTVSIGIRS